MNFSSCRHLGEVSEFTIACFSVAVLKDVRQSDDKTDYNKHIMDLNIQLDLPLTKDV